METKKHTVVGNLTITELPTSYNDSKRTIRIWTPSTYRKNGDVRYPVLYMYDGQNLFDEYTSFSGEWGIDESIEVLINELSIDGFIVVGIDNSADRMKEYLPPWDDNLESLGDAYGEFITDTVKPYIDSHFNTNPKREYTLIGGSSMGGLISFYLGLKYKHIFGYIMAMSSSFHIHTKEARQAFIHSLDMTDLPKLYLDSGYPKDNSEFIEPVRQELLSIGYPETRILTKITKGHLHHEQYWKMRFPEALKWLFNL